MVLLSPKRVAIMFSSGVLSSAGTVSNVQTNNLPQSSTSMAEMVEKYLSMLAKSSTGADLAILEGGGLRSKRSAPVEDLANIDRYFSTISAMDVDDCGKLLVCTLETVPAEERTPEENMIATLFGESSTIDPGSPKAEYDLAAYLGQATNSKVACARRYQNCPIDRKTISQALAKMARRPSQ
jgi:hypothetical protein